jgi:sec-independent protein translocase protein TatA
MGGGGFITMQSLIIILLIALVLFGGSRLRDLGGQLGGAIKDFRKSVREGEKHEDTDEDPKKIADTQAPQGRVIDGETRKDNDTHRS